MNKDKYDKLIRVDLDFGKELKEIKLERIKNGIDEELKSDRRLTEAIRRHHLFRQIKQDIIKAKLKDKRGSLMDLFIWVIIGFITVGFFATWLYAHGLITTELRNIPVSGTSLNLTAITNDTWGQVDQSMQSLRWITLVMFLSMAIAILISNFLIKVHPVFFVIYIFIVIIAIIFSAYLSNSYESLMVAPQIGDTITSFTGMTYIYLHLPIWVAVVGMFGGILLFIGLTKDQGQGGGII